MAKKKTAEKAENTAKKSTLNSASVGNKKTGAENGAKKAAAVNGFFTEPVGIYDEATAAKATEAVKKQAASKSASSGAGADKSGTVKAEGFGETAKSVPDNAESFKKTLASEDFLRAAENASAAYGTALESGEKSESAIVRGNEPEFKNFDKAETSFEEKYGVTLPESLKKPKASGTIENPYKSDVSDLQNAAAALHAEYLTGEADESVLPMADMLNDTAKEYSSAYVKAYRKTTDKKEREAIASQFRKDNAEELYLVPVAERELTERLKNTTYKMPEGADEQDYIIKLSEIFTPERISAKEKLTEGDKSKLYAIVSGFSENGKGKKERVIRALNRYRDTLPEDDTEGRGFMTALIKTVRASSDGSGGAGLAVNADGESAEEEKIKGVGYFKEPIGIFDEETKERAKAAVAEEVANGGTGKAKIEEDSEEKNENYEKYILPAIRNGRSYYIPEGAKEKDYINAAGRLYSEMIAAKVNTGSGLSDEGKAQLYSIVTQFKAYVENSNKGANEKRTALFNMANALEVPMSNDGTSIVSEGDKYFLSWLRDELDLTADLETAKDKNILEYQKTAVGEVPIYRDKGFISANYTVGNLGIQADRFGSLYAKTGDERYYEIAKKFKAISEGVAAENIEDINPDNLLSDIAANGIQNLPQHIDTLAEGAKLAPIAALAAMKGVPIKTVLKTLYVTASAKSGFEIMRGEAMVNLRDMGLSFEDAKKIADNEGFINAFIESGGAVLDVLTFGAGEALIKNTVGKLAGGVKKQIAKTAAKALLKLGISQEGVKTILKVAAATGAFTIDVLGEGAEEWLQSSVTMANEDAAMEARARGNTEGENVLSLASRAFTRDYSDEEKAERRESFKGGVKGGIFFSVGHLTAGAVQQGFINAANSSAQNKAEGNRIIKNGLQNDVLQASADVTDETGAEDRKVKHAREKIIKAQEEGKKVSPEEWGKLSNLTAAASEKGAKENLKQAFYVAGKSNMSFEDAKESVGKEITDFIGEDEAFLAYTKGKYERRDSEKLSDALSKDNERLERERGDNTPHPPLTRSPFPSEGKALKGRTESEGNEAIENGKGKIESVKRFFGIKNINDYINVQKSVFETLKSRGFFTDEGGRSRTVVNKESGLEIEINKSSIDETFSSGNKFASLGKELKYLKLATITDIAKLAENAHLISDSNKNYHSEKSGVNYAYLKTETTVDGMPVTVVMDIRKSPQKNKLWVHRVYTKANVETGPTGASSKIGLNAGLNVKDNISQKSENVKRGLTLEELLQSTKKDNRDEAQYYYSLGRMGEEIERVFSKPYAGGVFSDEEKARAWAVGKNDLKNAKRENGLAMKDRVTSLNAEELSKTTVRTINALYRRLGAKLYISDTVRNEAGQRVGGQTDINERTAYISHTAKHKGLKGEALTRYFAVHEAVHLMSEESKEAFNTLYESVPEELLTAEAVKEKIAEYEKSGITLSSEAAREEIVAEFIGEAIANADRKTLHKIIGDRRSIGEVLLDLVNRLINAFKGVNDELISAYKNARRAILDALSELEYAKGRSGDGKGNPSVTFGDSSLYTREPRADMGARAKETERHAESPLRESGKYAVRDEGGAEGKITDEDVKAVQSIGRKSVNDFTSEDIKKTESFARRYFAEIGAKSPFFRAWFGDWRANDETKIKVADQKGAVRGKIKNLDTGWDVQISRKVFDETNAHNSQKATSGASYLEYINSIVENAVLLDSFVIPEKRAKSVNSVMMHSLYAIADMGSGKEVLKLYIEELNDVNADGTIKRAYQLQNIENQQSGVIGSGNTLSHITQTADANTIADLYALVKQKDKIFNPKRSSKVVNEDGTPKVVYHGTSESFTVFDKEQYNKNEASGDYVGEGFFFTESEKKAQKYGNNIIKAYLDIKNPLVINTEEDARNFRNTFSGMYEEGLPSMREFIGGEYDYFELMRENPAFIREELQKRGYDGLIDNLYGQYAVLSPNQIKSATDNIGTFDRGNDDIRYAVSDEKDGAGAEEKKEQYIPKGEHPYRDIDIVAKTEKGKTSRFVRTVAESEFTTEEAAKNLQKAAAEGAAAYDTYTDKKAVSDANSWFEGLGSDIDRAAKSVEDLIGAGALVSKEAFAKAQLTYNKLIDEAVKAGDTPRAKELLKRAENMIIDVSIAGTKAGQTVQAMRLIKRLSPEGRLTQLKKAVDELNGKKKPDKEEAKKKTRQHKLKERKRNLSKQSTAKSRNAIIEILKKRNTAEAREALKKIFEMQRQADGGGIESVNGKGNPSVTFGDSSLYTREPLGERTESGAEGASVKESVLPYSEREKNNWKNSKKIVLYEDDKQFEEFVNKVLRNEETDKKIYFGKIPNATSQKILEKTGIDVSGHNIALKGYEIRKILINSHGNEVKEKARGQSAVTVEDLKNIPKIIANPDNVSLSRNEYEGKPTLIFEKQINGNNYVITYVSKKHNDIAIQTMYKKRSLATAENANARSMTSETTSSTASKGNISQNGDDVKYAVSDEKSDISRYEAMSEDELVLLYSELLEADAAREKEIAAIDKELSELSAPSLNEQREKQKNEAVSRGKKRAEESVARAREKLKAAEEEKTRLELEALELKDEEEALNKEIEAAKGEIEATKKAEEKLKKKSEKLKDLTEKAKKAHINVEAAKKELDIAKAAREAIEDYARLVEEENAGAKLYIPEDVAEAILKSRDAEELDAAMEVAAKVLAEQMPARFMGRRWREAWRYLAMLLNPTTHERNILSNTAMYLTVGMKDFISGAVSDVYFGVKEKKSTYNIPEYRENSLVRGFGEKERKETKNWIKEVVWNDVKDSTVMGGMGKGKDYYLSEIMKYVKPFKTKAMNKINDFNFNLLELEDVLFLKANFTRAFHSYMVANNLSRMDMARNKTLYDEATRVAAKEAREATFRDVSKLANSIRKLNNKHPLAGEIMFGGNLPFTRTPFNIAKRGAEYSVLGLGNAVYKKARDSFKHEYTYSDTDFINDISKGLTGSALHAAGMLLYGLGMVFIGGVDSDDEDKYRKERGEQNFSVKIGDYTYTIDWLQPACIPFLSGAALMKLLTEEAEKSEDMKLSDMLSIYTGLLEQAFEPLIQTSVLSSFSDALSAVREADNDSETIVNLFKQTIQNYAGQYVPSVLGKIARTIDPYERRYNYVKSDAAFPDTEYFLRKTAGKIPGLSRVNPPYVDMFGQEAKKKEGFGDYAISFFENMLSPGYLKKLETDKTDEEIIRLSKTQAADGKQVVNFSPPRTIKLDRGGYTEKLSLTGDEYFEIKAKMGSLGTKALRALVEGDAYESMSDAARAEATDIIWDVCYQSAVSEVVPDYHADRDAMIAQSLADDGEGLASYAAAMAVAALADEAEAEVYTAKEKEQIDGFTDDKYLSLMGEAKDYFSDYDAEEKTEAASMLYAYARARAKSEALEDYSLTGTNKKLYSIEEKTDISPAAYILFKKYKKEADFDKNGSYTQAEISEALRLFAEENGARPEDLAFLWQMETDGLSKNNPYAAYLDPKYRKTSGKEKRTWENE